MTSNTNVSSTPVIEVRNLSVAYQNTLALYEVSLDIYKGEYLGICGPNGSGKTTLIRTILGLVKPFSGTISIYGHDVSLVNKQTMKELLLKIGYVPQIQHIDRHFPAYVKDVVMMGRYPRIGLFRRPSSTDRAIVEEAMKMAEVYHLRNRPIGHLSGGQQQKVLIARALAQEPEIMLLDEPTSALDFKMTQKIMELLRKLRDEQGLTIVTILHDIELLRRYSTRIACLNQTMRWVGDPNSKELDALLQQLFIGNPIGSA